MQIQFQSSKIQEKKHRQLEMMGVAKKRKYERRKKCIGAWKKLENTKKQEDK